MRNCLLIITVLFFVLPVSQAQWEILSAGNLQPIGDTTLHDIYFINADTGFATGGEALLHEGFGSVFKTTDGGKTWASVFHSDIFSPRMLQFTNDSTGYFTTRGAWYYGSQLYRTTDGGYSWSVVLETAEEFCFTGEDRGFASSYDTIMSTMDGGATWDTVYITECMNSGCYITNLFFPDAEHGWFIQHDDSIGRYTAPDTWEKFSLEGYLYPLRLFFTDNQTGWISDGYLNEGNDYLFRLYKTRDGGETWSLLNGIEHLYYDLYFENQQHGWAVGENKEGISSIQESFDGGESWEIMVDSLPGRLTKLHFREGQLWAIGEHGLIMKYSGHRYWVDWAKLDNPHAYLSPGNSIARISVAFANPLSYPLEVTSTIESLDGTIKETLPMTHAEGNRWKVEWPVPEKETFYEVKLVAERSDTLDDSYHYSMGIPFTTTGPVKVKDMYYPWFPDGYFYDTVPEPGDTLFISVRVTNAGITDSIYNAAARIKSLSDHLGVYPYGGYSMLWEPLGPGDETELNFLIFITQEALPGESLPLEVNFYSMDRVYWKDTVPIKLYDPGNIPGRQGMNFTVYPNPANDHVFLRTGQNLNEPLALEIYGIRGDLVFQKIYPPTSDVFQQEISLRTMEPGIYFISLTSGRYHITKKLLKQ